MQRGLEEHTFGPDIDAAGGPPVSLCDRMAAYMLPLLLTIVMTSVVVYSLGKGIEYQDLFQNRRYRMYLFAINMAVIVGSTGLIAYVVHREAIKQPEAAS